MMGPAASAELSTVIVEEPAEPLTSANAADIVHSECALDAGALIAPGGHADDKMVVGGLRGTIRNSPATRSEPNHLVDEILGRRVALGCPRDQRRHGRWTLVGFHAQGAL